jgi:hypothetical protein
VWGKGEGKLDCVGGEGKLAYVGGRVKIAKRRFDKNVRDTEGGKEDSR